MRREMDACQCWERSPGKAGYGELSLMPTLAVLDSYQRQPTDEQIERHHQLLVTVLCSCCCLPSWASCFTPSCQHNMARAVSLQWDHFLYPATPFQVHLKYLPVPQYHLGSLSAELQRDGDNLTQLSNSAFFCFTRYFSQFLIVTMTKATYKRKCLFRAYSFQNIRVHWSALWETQKLAGIGAVPENSYLETQLQSRVTWE